MSASVMTRITAAFGQAGLEGWLHALDIDTGAALSCGGHQLCVAASTGKVPILVGLMRAVAAGRLKLDDRVMIEAGGRTGGPTGLSKMSHRAELSVRDIALLMISVSDNHATDVLLGFVPPEQVTASMRELGLTATTLDQSVSEEFRQLAARDPAKADLRPEAMSWRTTPAEMCDLLRSIWLDQAAPPELCAQMREVLGSFQFSNGLDSHFPIQVQARAGGKTGTMFYVDPAAGKSLVVRNEIGVLQYPGGGRYAVAVYTRQVGGQPLLHDLGVSDAIGTAARIAVDHLRTGGEAAPAGGEYPQVVPYLLYADAGAAMDWLTATLGFTTRARMARADGTVRHGELETGGGSVIMVGSPGPDFRGPAALGGATSLVRVTVARDLAGHRERAVAAGAQPSPIEPGPPGWESYTVTDPEGHQWYFTMQTG